jgi:hypothetical protein
MPLQTQPKQLQRDTVYQFMGLNLGLDEELIGPNDLARASNIDCHTKPGMLRVRLGEVLQSESGLGKISKITRFNNSIAYVAGETLVVGATSTTGLTGPVTSFLEFEPFNTDKSYLFVANRGRMLRVDPDAGIKPWGLSIPTTPAVQPITTGSLTGSYSVVVTYARREGTALVEESNPSNPSPSLALASQGLRVTVAASTDDQVNEIRIYRTTGSGVSYLFDTAVSNVTQHVTLVKPDSGLSGIVGEESGLPPVNTGIAVVHNDRLWLFDDTTVYYSNKFRSTFPALNYQELTNRSDPIVGAVSYRGILGVFTESRHGRLVEQVAGAAAVGADLPFFGGTESSFIFVEAPSRRGAIGHNAMVGTEAGVAFVAADGVYITDFSQLDEPIAETIKPLFLRESAGNIDAINWNLRREINIAFHKSRVYMAVPTAEESAPNTLLVYSFATQRWVAYSHQVTAMHWDVGSDLFYYGTTAGDIRTFERLGVYTDDTEPITFLARTGRQNSQQPMTRKQYLTLRVDVNITLTDTLNCYFYVDGALKATLPFGTAKALWQLPAGSQGYTWAVEFAGESSSLLEIKGVEVGWVPFQLI